jgi:hypothetical protein
MDIQELVVVLTAIVGSMRGGGRAAASIVLDALGRRVADLREELRNANFSLRTELDNQDWKDRELARLRHDIDALRESLPSLQAAMLDGDTRRWRARISGSLRAERKILVIKALREAAGLGLKEAKELVESDAELFPNPVDARVADILLRTLGDTGGLELTALVHPAPTDN